jgi:hypothetical protein
MALVDVDMLDMDESTHIHTHSHYDTMVVVVVVEHTILQDEMVVCVHDQGQNHDPVYYEIVPTPIRSNNSLHWSTPTSLSFFLSLG